MTTDQLQDELTAIIYGADWKDELLGTFKPDVAAAMEAVEKYSLQIKKSSREFRNALYQHFIDNDVHEVTAKTLAAESELYVEAYHAYQLRGIEFAAKQMGFDPEKMRREAAV